MLSDTQILRFCTNGRCTPFIYLIFNFDMLGLRFFSILYPCYRLAAASDKVYQLLAHGRWSSSGTPASSTTKTGPHDIAEILLKVALNTNNQINQIFLVQLSLVDMLYHAALGVAFY